MSYTAPVMLSFQDANNAFGTGVIASCVNAGVNVNIVVNLIFSLNALLAINALAFNNVGVVYKVAFIAMVVSIAAFWPL